MGLLEYVEIRSLATVCKVCSKETTLSSRSTGAKKASSDGDLLRRKDEKMAAEAIYG